jgi:hypothetical protein
MPYKSLEEAKIKELEGTPLTLAQVNKIAEVADSIENGDGWAIAISQFKKTHKVKDGRWVEKSDNSRQIHAINLASNFEIDGELFVKEVAKTGKFKSGEGRIIEFTTDMFKELVGNFKKSEAEVPSPIEHNLDPLANAGWVKDLFINGDSLFAKFDITNAEVLGKIKEGSIRHNSVGLVKKGGKWILEHIALTNLPIITGMETFKPVELSSVAGQEVEIFNYSRMEEESETKEITKHYTINIKKNY